METEVVLLVKGPVNDDVAAIEAYQALQNRMRNDHYIGLVPTILRLKYLSPLPLPVPPGTDGDTDSESIPVTAERASVSPWTIGASIACIMGGFVSILLWARRYRQRRH